MNFNWSEYYELAKYLAPKADSEKDFRRISFSEEADYRSCISRAYYAAFNRAVQFLTEKEDFNPARGYGSHDAVIEKLEEKNYPDRNTIAEYLRQMKRYRVRADYYTDFMHRGDYRFRNQDNILFAVQRTLQRARFVIDSLDNME